MSEGELVLGAWRVLPSRNLLVRDGAGITVEPKMMDVLVFLSENAGRVVSKQAIGDAVWPGTWITESVITRAIAGLRKATGDDARNPQLIETIPKRGYRLIIEPTHPTAGSSTPRPGSSPQRGAPNDGYPVGRWVTGPLFFGREAEIDELLSGHRSLVWLLGNRAIGKTSLLRQLERIAGEEREIGNGFFPLYWDLQGIDSPQELHEDFRVLLEEADDRLEGVGVDLAATAPAGPPDLFRSLRRLLRALSASGRRLLLLIDEAEELIQLSRRDPSLLRKLRRALQSPDGLRAIMASSSRLWQLAEQRDDTSPFLHGLAPPLCLGALSEEDALAMALRVPSDGSPLDEATGRELVRLGGGHPFLVQLLCRETIALGNSRSALAVVAEDPGVGLFFRVDFELLRPVERELLKRLAPEKAGLTVEDAGPDETAVLGPLVSLERLGMVRRDGSRFAVASEVLRRWLLSGAADEPSAQKL